MRNTSDFVLKRGSILACIGADPVGVFSFERLGGAV